MTMGGGDLFVGIKNTDKADKPTLVSVCSRMQLFIQVKRQRLFGSFSFLTIQVKFKRVFEAPACTRFGSIAVRQPHS